MNVLLSLPRLRKVSIDATVRAAITLRMGVTAATRARAARRLREALHLGLISPDGATAAVEQGDLAVAALLRPLSDGLHVPNLLSAATECLPVTRQLATEQLQALLGIARRFVRDGDLPVDQLTTLAQGSADGVGLLVVLQQAWQQRCDRLTERLLPGHVDPDATICYALSLVPLLDALDAIGGGSCTPMAMLEEPLPGGVLCELVSWPLVRLPAHPEREPQFYRAFMGVWNCLVNAARTPLVAPLDTAMIDLTGTFGEALHDAATTATWRNGVPSFSAMAKSQLADEFDIDLDDHADAIGRYALWLRAAKAKPLVPNTPAFLAWESTEATPAQRALLSTLMGIIARLKRATARLPVHTQSSWSGSGCLPVSLQPHEFGLDDVVQPYFEDMYSSGEYPLWQCVPDKGAQEPADLLAMADRVILETVAITACLNEILRHAEHVPTDRADE